MAPLPGLLFQRDVELAAYLGNGPQVLGILGEGLDANCLLYTSPGLYQGRPQLGDGPVEHQAVPAAVQSQGGLPPHLRLEGGQLPRFDVGWVGGHKVQALSLIHISRLSPAVTGVSFLGDVCPQVLQTLFMACPSAP